MYRVWCHPELGAEDVADGSDYFVALATYPQALAYAKQTRGAEEPIALIRQRQWIDEPKPGKCVHVKKVRITEWPVEFLGTTEVRCSRRHSCAVNVKTTSTVRVARLGVDILLVVGGGPGDVAVGDREMDPNRLGVRHGLVVRARHQNRRKEGEAEESRHVPMEPLEKRVFSKSVAMVSARSPMWGPLHVQSIRSERAVRAQ